MGYTHFDKVSGKNGLAVGAKDSEVTVADSSGYLYQVGTKITATAAEINKLDGYDPQIEYITTQVDDLSSASTTYVVMPACTVTKAWSVIHGTIDNDTTLTLKNNGGTSMTDGAITITASGSAAGDIDSCTPSDNNTFTEGQVLQIACDGASTSAVRATITIKITRATS